jgi:hypothetical protein
MILREQVRVVLGNMLLPLVSQFYVDPEVSALKSSHQLSSPTGRPISFSRLAYMSETRESISQSSTSLQAPTRAKA